MRKEKNNRRIAALIVSALLIISGAALSYADEYTDLEAINKQISNVQSSLKAGRNRVSQLNQQIKSLEAKISSTQAEINALQGSIDLTLQRIAEAKEEIKSLEEDIARQNDALNTRLRAMYKNGKVGFIDVLLGSSSLTNFMTNLDRVQMVYDSDKELLESLGRQKEMVEAQKVYLEQMEQKLESEKALQAGRKDELEEDRSEAAGQRYEAQLSNEQIEAQLDALKADADRLTTEIIKLQSKNTQYIGGGMMWPTPGITRITSPFGWRIHPTLKVNKLHTGVDIGCGTGTKVLAANAGTVIKAEYYGSYGNCVMIDHGGGIVTLYGHNSSFLVKQGDIVVKGQAVSLSGATGRVTGPHLHFEVRVNGEYVNPLNYVVAQ